MTEATPEENEVYKKTLLETALANSFSIRQYLKVLETRLEMPTLEQKELFDTSMLITRLSSTIMAHIFEQDEENEKESTDSEELS